MGGIITTDCVVQRLTGYLWIPPHSVHDDPHFYRLVRVLYALKESTDKLASWYDGIQDSALFDPLNPDSHPRFFPSPDTYPHNSAPVQFAYQAPLERNVSCVTYRAKTLEDSPKDIVVKFVTSYGEDAHREMELAGFAPKLLYYGPIDTNPDMPSYGDLRMVVMEYVKGRTFDKALERNEVPSRFKSDLLQAIKQLHNAGYVFGDLREPNVMVTPQATPTVQLIDFDWTGKEGEVKYPRSISGSIEWPQGAGMLELIRKEHDLEMLDRLTSRC